MKPDPLVPEALSPKGRAIDPSTFERLPSRQPFLFRAREKGYEDMRRHVPLFMRNSRIIGGNINFFAKVGR